MSTNANAAEPSGQAEPLRIGRAGSSPGLRAVMFAAVVGLAHLPLLLGHLWGLWLYRPHYHVYPLLAAGIVGWLWTRGPRLSGWARPSWWATGLLAGGLLGLTLAVLLGSPWWGAVAAVLSSGGLLGRYAVPEPDRSWLPAWLLLGLVVPLPFQWDFALLNWLQSTSLQAASGVLDLAGVRHLLAGQVLVLPDRRLLIDEICSGLPALPLLFALTALTVTLARRPLLWSTLLLAGSVAWAWLANAARVWLSVVAQQWYHWDWFSGWKATAVTWGTGLAALILLASTNRGLAFLLRPIAARRGGMRLPSEITRNPLNRAWNWLVGASPGAAGSRRPDGPPRTGSSAVANKPKRTESRRSDTKPLPVPSSPKGRDAGWLAAFGLLGMLQVAWLALPLLSADRASVGGRPVDRSLPATLAGWTLQARGPQVGRQGDPGGRFSSQWESRLGTLVCQVSVGGPIPEGQDPALRFRALGWRLTPWQVAGGDGPGDEAVTYGESELSTSAGEHGWLLAGHLDPAGRPIPAAGTLWADALSQVVRGPLGSLWRRRPGANLAATAYRIEAFASGVSPLSADDQAEIRRLFVAARARISGGSPRTQPAERQP